MLCKIKQGMKQKDFPEDSQTGMVPAGRTMKRGKSDER